jgi:hypothetical protein
VILNWSHHTWDTKSNYVRDIHLNFILTLHREIKYISSVPWLNYIYL